MANDPRPQSSTSFRGGGALGGGESLLNFEEGKKAAAKAEYITVPPESSFLGGATYRDKIRGALRSLGANDRSINYVVGDMRSDNLTDNIGLLDLTPAAIPLAVQEGSRAFKQGRYLEGSLDLGLSALEMLPGIKLATTPIKGFLNSIASKLSKSTDNLGALPVDESRREFLAQTGTAAVAAPVVVGALGDLPVGKIIEDVIPASNLPSAMPVAKVAGKVVKNVGQPARIGVINDLMDITGFGEQFHYGHASMKEIVAEFSSEINKARKYFELKKKTVDIDELDMLSPNNEMAERLDELQIEFGYSDDQMIKFIDETNSATKENEKLFGRYLIEGEGDPEVGKALGLDGDEWNDNDFWEKIYGSFEEDIAGNRIANAE